MRVVMEKECGCFKKSGMSAVQEFASKAEAMKVANEMVEDMNETFCQKHNFSIVEQDQELLIKVELN
ncbi:MAG: hypothetical protein KU37_07925 [Sulfuricurvum sp. PC08-66]|nr:MAG: hypothetical protein KU37_07925 [Sulfuricurvum sp. PC08-66]